MDMTALKDDESIQDWALSLLRILIGWHLLYEGLVKFRNPGWSAGAYLQDSEGWFAGFFTALAGNPTVLAIVDAANVWGLMLIGAALLLGFLVRPALIAGIALLSLYYLSHPPLLVTDYLMPAEGNYLFVDKTLIEIASMLVLLVSRGSDAIGVSRLFNARAGRHANE